MTTSLGRASAVILYRIVDGKYRVFMTKRSLAVISFPGFWVFPGGKENVEDCVIADSWAQTPRLNLFIHQQEFQNTMAPDFLKLMGLVPSLETHVPFGPHDWNCLMITALRELWEETGIAYSLPALPQEERYQVQQALLTGESLLQLMTQYHFGLNWADIRAIGRITTPNLGEHTRRFDTAFFMVPQQDSQTMHLSPEVAETQWIDPQQALDHYGAALPIPTRYILMQLQQKFLGEIVS